MSPKMKRLQIYLESDVDRELSHLANKRGVSKAQLLRDGARRIISEQLSPKDEPVLSIVALGHLHPDRISEEHDQYLLQKKLKLSR